VRTVVLAGVLSCCLSACSAGTTVLSCEPACPAGFRCAASGCVADVAIPPPDLAAPVDGTIGCSPACAGDTPRCNPRGVCVQCLDSADCPIGQRCTALGEVTVCTPGCSDDSRCRVDGGTASCCQGECSDTRSDVRNCGACGARCAVPNAAGLCQGGACLPGACDPGWDDCNQQPADGCEANLHTDPSNCGSCAVACAFPHGVAACSDACYLAACDFGFDDCNDNPVDGCEASVLDDVKNCGGCALPCPAAAHGRGACQDATCGLLSCDVGFADCDLAFRNGCEVPTSSDVKNCGACGNACDNGQVCKNGACTCPQCNLNNARSGCKNQQCVLLSCVPGFGNCDGVDKNGCEVDLQNDAANCGGCGAPCPVNAPVCSASACVTVPASSAMWLRADTLGANDGDPIGLWPDQSGNGNDALQNSMQRQPLFHTNVLGGLPALSFDGLDDALGIKSATTVTDFSFFIVYRLTAGAMAGNAYYPIAFGADQNISGQYAGIETLNGASGNSPGILDIFAGFGNDARATLDGISAFDEWKILSSVTTTTSHSVTVRSNGVDAAMSGTGGDVMMSVQLGDNSGGGWGGIGGTGSQAFGSYAARCDVAEVLVYPSALGDLDRQAVESYLNGKYQVF